MEQNILVAFRFIGFYTTTLDSNQVSFVSYSVIVCPYIWLSTYPSLSLSGMSRTLNYWRSSEIWQKSVSPPYKKLKAIKITVEICQFDIWNNPTEEVGMLYKVRTEWWNIRRRYICVFFNLDKNRYIWIIFWFKIFVIYFEVCGISVLDPFKPIELCPSIGLVGAYTTTTGRINWMSSNLACSNFFPIERIEAAQLEIWLKRTVMTTVRIYSHICRQSKNLWVPKLPQIS